MAVDLWMRAAIRHPQPLELAGATVAEVERFCADLRALVLAETGLVASIGAGSGKQIAKIASGLAKPDGITVVAPGIQAELMADLPVRKLWGIGPVAGERLHRLGIDTIGKFVATPESEVASILGATMGPSLHQLARGIDNRVVAERAEAKQISAESTFAADLTTAGQVAGAIRRSAEGAHRRLLVDGRAARTVTVKVRRSDFTSITRSYTLPEGTTSLETIISVARSLAPDPVDFGAIRLLGVGVSGLTEFHQDALFEQEFAPGPRTSDDDDEDLPDIVGVGTTVTTEDSGSADPDDRAADGSAVDAPPAIGAWRTGEQERFRTGADVRHPDFGHGWVQGSGHGRVSVRFETAATGPGRMCTFDDDDPALEPADPLDSLGW